MAASNRQPQSMTCAYRIEGMDCPDCAATLERGIREVPGVTRANVNFGTASLDVTLTSPENETMVKSRVEAMGYHLASIEETPGEAPTFWEQHRPLALTTLATLAWIIGGILQLTQRYFAATIAFAISILVGGLSIYRRAYGAALARTLDLHILMTIAVVGAAAIGQWGEGAAVVVLFAIGNVLEALTTRHARQAISQLMEQAPERAVIRRDGQEITIPVEEARIGDIAIVRPGEKIPLDGRVIAGASAVNEAAITGEALPHVKGQGDNVYAGTLNERGALEIEVTKPYRESAFARIIQLVEEAQNSKPRVQQQIDRFAKYYTPAIVALAFVVAIVGLILGVANPITRALALLIIGCPCALVLASPIAIIAGISRAAREGILVKQGIFLETGSHIRAVAFDKTGTLTRGRPQVQQIIPADGVSEREMLAFAAGLEQYSEHHLGQAIRRAAHRNHVEPLPVTDFESLTGLGVRGKYQGEDIRLGSPRLWKELSPLWQARVHDAEVTGATVLILSREKEIIGLFMLNDEPRPEAAGTVKELAENHYAISLITGDTAEAAQALGKHVGITDIAARLLPEEKVRRAHELRTEYGPVAVVGDGVNDAPALSASDLGIAMAAVGNDTAIASADVVLVSDDLSSLPAFFDLCRRTRAVIRQNIAFAVLVKVALVGFAIGGLLPLWLAVIGDVGTTIIVILSGMRLLR